MTSAPVRLYARWLGWGASALRRLAVAGAAGVVVAGAVVAAGVWQLGLLVGWIATALAFLLTIAPILLRADAEATEALAVREDLNREVARLVLLAASSASLVAVGLALELAQRETGVDRALLLTLSARHGRGVVDRGEHAVHPALRPPLLPAAGRRHRLR